MFYIQIARLAVLTQTSRPWWPKIKFKRTTTKKKSLLCVPRHCEDISNFFFFVSMNNFQNISTKKLQIRLSWQVRNYIFLGGCLCLQKGCKKCTSWCFSFLSHMWPSEASVANTHLEYRMTPLWVSPTPSDEFSWEKKVGLSWRSL